MQVRAMSRAYEHASDGAHSFTGAHNIQAERQWQQLEWQQLEQRLWWLWFASAPAGTEDLRSR